MAREPLHLSDQDILLVLDGEASRRRSRQVQTHLAACPQCRSRRSELESTIGDFVSLHRHALDHALPVASGRRALLKARLAEAAAGPASTPLFLRMLSLHRIAILCVAVMLSLFAGTLLWKRAQAVADLSVASAAIPDHNLTPGATRPVSIGDVCSMPHEEVVRDVPDSLREQVFREYGIVNPRAQDYEIDYLIAPGLGGAEDVHNLWPEPSTSSTWNAHVKDALEERLHQLVCEGKLDLPTAQRAIATDWITAYKRYFSAEQPSRFS